MSLDVNLNAASPSIELDKSDSQSTYIRKSNIVRVIAVSNKNLQTVNPSAPRDSEFLIHIQMTDGSQEVFDIQDVDNQVTWTANDAGLAQAASDIAQAN